MKQVFSFDFENQSAAATGKRYDSITHPIGTGDEVLRCSFVDGVPYISGNADGLIKLGKLLLQIGVGGYQDGFHLHLYEDFNANKEDALIIGKQS